MFLRKSDAHNELADVERHWRKYGLFGKRTGKRSFLLYFLLGGLILIGVWIVL